MVDEQEKHRRCAELIKLSEEKTKAFYERHIGEEMEVLFERSTRGKAMHGFTPNYIRVELAAKDAREEYDNQLMRVRLGAFNRDGSALKAIGL